jgi:phage terminase large subunit-like protein
MMMMKWKQTTVGWRKLHSDDLQNLYSAGIVRTIKSMWVKWVGRNANKNCTRTPEGRNH